MTIKVKDVKLLVNYVNNYALKDSSYTIRYERHSGHNWLYLHEKEDDRRLRYLFGGTKREVYAYMTALQNSYWYMNETI